MAQHGKKWIFYVQELEFAWRHSTLKWASTTPFAATLGFEGPLPMDLLAASPAAQLIADGARFHAEHLARLAESWQLIERKRVESERKRTGDDPAAQPIQIYYEGDECIAWIPGASSGAGARAFMTNWRGPFLVSRRLGPKT